jgi:hypothetical protein
MEVALYYKGIEVKRFIDTPFNYYNYLYIDTVFPVRGSRQGGTQITL